MRGPLIPSPFWATLIVCLIAVNLLVSEIEAKRSSGSRKSGSSSSGGFFSSRKKTNNQQPQPTQHKPPSQPSPSSSGSFLDNERKTGGHVGSGQPVGNRPGGNNPIGFEHYNNRQPSAPLPPGHQPTGGLGSAFGGAKPNNPPYPTHNNPGGFGSNPGGFGSNPGGFGSNTGHHPQGGYNSPGGFGSNTGGFGHNQGGFGSNTGHHPQGGYNSPGGFGGNTGGFGGNTGGFGGNTGGFGHNQGGFGSNTGGHHPQGGYNAPGGGFGGTHHNSQPGYGNQPHYNQPGGYHGGQQHGYGGGAPGYHPPANSYGSYPAGYGGQPHYGGGHSPQYNPGGFGGGYHPSGGYGGYGGQGYMPGGKVKSGPGIGTGLLGGAAAALPLGLLVGYGLGSMGSHSSPFSGSSHSAAPASPAAAAAPANNDAFNEWLKQRTAEEKKKEEAAIAAGAVAGGAAAAGAAGAASSVLINKDGVTTVNETALVSRILEQTSMCPGGAGILEASFLNTLVPCNATEVDFQETNLTIPYEDDCKTIKMTLIQLNPTTNENKSVSLTIKQINVESGLPGDLAYDMSFDSCLSAIGKPEEKFCVNRGFTIDQYHTINETLAFLHTANFSITQFNTTLFPHMSCPTGGDCANKETRNLTSTFVNLSLLPLHPVTLLMSQCMIFNRSQCDPASTQPCDLPQLTVKQSIDTNTTLSTVDFASINFVLHGSKDIFLTFQPPPPPPQEKAAQNADQVGSSSTLTDTTTKSSATTI